MRNLSISEMDAVSGGFSFFGITEIEAGLKTFSHVNQVFNTAVKSFAVGVAIGTGINHLYEWGMGDTIGGDLYDLCQMVF